MDYTIRPATSDEIPAMQETMGFGFGFDPMPELRELFAATVELDRTRCAFEGATLVGTSGAFSLDLTVPGGSLPTGGTTMVAVRSRMPSSSMSRRTWSTVDSVERTAPLPPQVGQVLELTSIRLGRSRWRDNSKSPKGLMRPN